MLRIGNLRVHYSDIPSRITGYFGDRVKGQHELDSWDYDLRNQTLLHRDAAGHYEFAHKSLAEYFVAYKFGLELGCLRNEFLDTYREADGRPCKPFRGEMSVNSLSQTFGFMSMTDSQMWAVRRLLAAMLDTKATDQLWKIVADAQAGESTQTGCTGANALTLLNDLRADLRGHDFSGSVLQGTDLSYADLRETSFERADLAGSWLSNSYLAGANFRESELRDLRFEHVSGVRSVHFLGKGGEIASGSTDGAVEVWRPGYERPHLLLGTVRGASCLAVRVDGKRFAANSEDNRVIIWDAAGVKLAELRHAGRVVSMSYNPTGEQLAVVEFANGILTVWDTQDYRVIKRLRHPDAHIGYCVRYSPDGTYLAAMNVEGGAAVWRTDDESVVATLQGHESKAEDVCFTYDASLLVTGGYDNRLVVWKAASWTKLNEMAERDMIATLAASPVARVIATGLHDGYVCLWDLDEGVRIKQIRAHGGSVFAVCFSHDGQQLATAGKDARIKVWDVERGTCKYTFSQALMCSGLDLRGVRNIKHDYLQILATRGAVLDKRQEKAIKGATT
jgi:WD40 repeat protein